MNISEQKERQTQTELDSLVVNIELTLISIIQGVALYFLTENSKALILERQWLYFPYILSALFIIFTFWSRSIIHTLTVIRWPLQFGHNFLYIAATWIEAISFTQLSNPLHWFGLQAVFAFVLWCLFVSDLQIIGRRMEDSQGSAGDLLYEKVRKDQFINIRFLFPINILFNAGVYFLLRQYPEYFLIESGHFWVAFFQSLVTLGYLAYGVYFYKKLAPAIARTRREWRDDTLIED